MRQSATVWGACLGRYAYFLVEFNGLDRISGRPEQMTAGAGGSLGFSLRKGK